MKTDVQSLKNSFKVSYNVYRDSINEAEEVINLYHNRQYTPEQKAILTQRGQPKETFNVIKLFARLLLGYYSNVVNEIEIEPLNIQDINSASVLNDVVKYIFKDNQMDTIGDEIKLDGILTGIFASYIYAEDIEDKDEFGRPIRKVKIEYVPSLELLLDPMSRAPDYSDARFIHRYKWVSKDQITNMYGSEKVKELEAYFNYLNIQQADFEYKYGERFVGNFKQLDNYLIVQSIVIDDEGKTWEIIWCDEVILSKTEVTYREVRFPYRIHKLNVSNKAEFYGVFREIVESQKAINQALVKIQLMVNTQKAFVQNGAVDNLAEFTDQFNRVNAIIPVNELAGIRIENLNADIAQQYTIIDRALDRIQRILGINDSFLGMAYASDSGAKVKLQQGATIMSLRYITQRIEQFYRMLGWDIVKLVKQYYNQHQILRVTDEITGAKWVEINKPLMQWTGQMDQNGQPIMKPVLEPVVDPATRKVMKDKWGNIIVAPVPTKDTDIQFARVNINVTAVAHNDEDEKNMMLMQNVLQGPSGQLLAQVNPAAYFKITALGIQSMKTKYSPEISDIFMQTAQMLASQQQMQAQAQQANVPANNMTTPIQPKGQ